MKIMNKEEFEKALDELDEESIKTDMQITALFQLIELNLSSIKKDVEKLKILLGYEI